jgi:signal transduction histidine kinase/CheY-like chemotaxis protein
MRTDVTAPTLAFEAQERLSRQQQIVGTLSQFALTALDPQLLREKAVALVAEGLGLEMATVLERDEGAKTFHVHAVIGMPLQAGGYLVPMGDGLAAAALAAAEPFVFEDAASDRRFRLHPALEKAEVRSGIVVKIAGHRAPLGLLSAFSRAPRGFDQDQVGFVKAMAFVLSTAAERRQAEMILSQAQRLDSLGQLTGGIAHDFNNLLTVIAGHAEVLADEVPGGSEHAEMIRSIRSAAKRAAELTHQLLAFARGQTLQTSDIEINELVREMQPLLRRTIEENVELRTILDQSLPRCRTDRAQLSAAIMNLAINARDAMPSGGAITIESGMASLDQAFAAQNPEVEPGDYVVLSVTDTGTGMAPEVASRVFEPFFTTKPVGKGTGLGLSMVYGFMKQSGGHVKIYSEVGVGTSVKLYIPIATGHSVQDAAGSAGNMPRGHGERILVVEDEIQVRNFAAGQLKRLGYTVIEACDGREALELLRGGAAVDLVFSDMIMPGGISGPQLARELGGMRPGLRVIFTSGYPAGAIQHGAEGELGRFSLLTKPYTVAQLARQIRQSLDGAESDR